LGRHKPCPKLIFIKETVNPLNVPISLCPHIDKEKPKGYYITAQRLFPEGQPVIFRQQFAGYMNHLILTLAHQSTWNTLLKMVLHAPLLDGVPVNWLAPIKQYRMGTGVRFYLPGSILKPGSAEDEKIETMGIIRRAWFKSGDIIYVDIPLIDANVLLGKKELK